MTLVAPEWVTDNEAVAMWWRTVRLVTEADHTMLGVYCNLHSDIATIWRAGLAPDPALLNELRACAIALGFTPASRGFTPNRIPR